MPLHPYVAVVLRHSRLGVQEGQAHAALGTQAGVVAAALLDGVLVELVSQPAGGSVGSEEHSRTEQRNRGRQKETKGAGLCDT